MSPRQSYIPIRSRSIRPKPSQIDAITGGKKGAERKVGDKKIAVLTETNTLIGKAQKLREYFEDAKTEFKRITWPTRKETIATSIAVVILVFVISLFLGIVDLGLTKIVAIILS